VGNTITLRGNGADLEVDTAVNDLGWTLCYLVCGKRTFLGADSLPCVVKGLSRALQDNDDNTEQPAGEINGISVRYALHLEEAHHSLYYGEEGNTRLLFWQADQHHPVTLVGVIRLSPSQRRQWTQALAGVLKEIKEPLLVGR
jgi:hypothetical protein